MGRRDAVATILEVVTRARQIEPRLVVTYEPGWETRGNGTSANYEGLTVHHTGSPSSLARPFPTQTLLRVGRTDLAGPLSNFAGPACTVELPRLHVVAAHPANHAGASGGRSMGPLPVTTLFNPRVLGHEVDYAGTVPMLPGQLAVVLILGRAVVDVLGVTVEHVRAHAETSITGKWDPGEGPGRTVDMAALRRSVAGVARAVTAPRLSGDLVRLVKAVGTSGPIYLVTDLTVDGTNDINLVEAEARANGVTVVDLHPAQIDLLRRSRADRRKALGLPPVATPLDVDEKDLALYLAPALAAGVVDLNDGDLDRIAIAAADEVDRRQRTRLG